MHKEKIRIPQIRQARRYALPLVIILTGIALSVIAFVVVKNLDLQKIRNEFEQDSEERYEALRREIGLNLNVLDSVRAFYQHGKISRSEFREFVGHFLSRHPSIQALEWIPRIPNSQRKAYERMAKKDGFSHFQLADRRAKGEMVRAPQRKEYFPVYFVEPFKGNEIALGFDLGSDQTRLEALERSRDTGEMVATTRITLVQETGEQFGFLVFEPIYRKGAPTDSIESRRENLEGFVLGVFRIGSILGKSITNLNPKDIEIFIYDNTGLVGERLLGRYTSSSTRNSVMGNEEVNPTALFKFAKTFHLGGRQWIVLCTPMSKYIVMRTTWQPWGALFIGLLFTAFSGSYLLININRTERIEGLVRERTGELQKTNEALSHEIAIRKGAEQALQKSEERYRTLFEQSKDAIYTTSQEGEILDANRSMFNLFGYSREEMIGLNAREAYVFSEDRLKFQQRIEREGFVRDYGIKLRKKDGAEMDCLLTATMRRTADGNILGYQGIIRDITEHKRMEEALKESEVRYRLLAENASDTIWTVNMDMQVTYMSPSVTRLLGYTVEEAKSRTMEEAFTQASFETAKRALVEEMVLENTRQGDPNRSRILELELTHKDGGVVPVEANFTFLRDAMGKPVGILSIARDITERKQAEEKVKQASEEWELTFNSINDLVSIHDKDFRIVKVNKAFADTFGMGMQNLLGKNATKLFMEQKNLGTTALIVKPCDVESR